MKRIDTDMSDVFLIEPRVFGDSRGYFFESYHEQKFRNLGIKTHFVQDNRSRSSRGVLRGLHFQLHCPQAKLCSVLQGEVFDVAVDIRVGSPNFGKWVGVILSEDNKRQMFIPEGYAHGFVVLSETAEFSYKCGDFYHPEDEGGVLWCDPSLGIAWPKMEYVLSDKDKCYLPLNDIPEDKLPHYSFQKEPL
ncbi:MAG: dTDP-4-dehydrorhamnose 3,5-epimerase [Cyanobacteria bacterium J06642_2]